MPRCSRQHPRHQLVERRLQLLAALRQVGFFAMPQRRHARRLLHDEQMLVDMDELDVRSSAGLASECSAILTTSPAFTRRPSSRHRLPFTCTRRAAISFRTCDQTSRRQQPLERGRATGRRARSISE